MKLLHVFDIFFSNPLPPLQHVIEVLQRVYDSSLIITREADSITLKTEESGLGILAPG